VKNSTDSQSTQYFLNVVFFGLVMIYLPVRLFGGLRLSSSGHNMPCTGYKSQCTWFLFCFENPRHA
jgi:hypothetical protein